MESDREGEIEMLVKDIMIVDFPTLQQEHTIQDALQKFTTIHSNIIPVTNKEDKLIGILTKNKVIQALASGALQNDTIAQLTNRNPVYVYAEDLINETRELLLSHKLGQAPVVDENMEPIGVLSTTQILFAYSQQFDFMQSRLSLLFNNLNFGLLSVNKEMKVNAVNPFANQALKLSNDEMMMRQPIQNEEIVQLLRSVLEKKEEEVNKKISISGYSIFIRCYPLIEKKELIGAMLLMENMTQLEKTVEELQFSKEWEEKLRSVIELAYDGFIIVNQQGEISMVNDGFCELFNADEKNILGLSVKELFPILGIHDVLNTGIKMNNVAKLIGSTQCLITTLPIKNDEGIVGAICKITYRGLKHLQEALNRVDKLEKQVTYYQKELHQRKGTKYSFADIIGESRLMQKTKDEALSASQSLSTVLLLGESGTGKELFASGIHAASKQPGKLVQVNCAAIPADLLESEFFGYGDGAFTGAKKGGKKGKFELAQNGTLFLDEIGDMPLMLQTKLLRVLQEKEFEPVGSNRLIKLNTKIVAATHQNLEQLIKEGKFREDLYYRLNIMTIRIPPLRDRKEDIQEIAESIIDRLNQSGFYLKGVTHSALTKLVQYHWPGNVRELHNFLERAANLTEDGYIDVPHLPDFLTMIEIPQPIGDKKTNVQNEEPALYHEVIKTKEKRLILNALAEANGNKAKASRILGISRTWLYAKMKKHNIQG